MKDEIETLRGFIGRVGHHALLEDHKEAAERDEWKLRAQQFQRERAELSADVPAQQVSSTEHSN